MLDTNTNTNKKNSGQVIEIFGLAEHLLTECEFKDAFAPCPKSGLAVRRDQLEVRACVMR